MFDVMAKEIGLVGRFTPSYMTVLPPNAIRSIAHEQARIPNRKSKPRMRIH